MHHRIGPPAVPSRDLESCGGVLRATSPLLGRMTVSASTASLRWWAAPFLAALVACASSNDLDVGGDDSVLHRDYPLSLTPHEQEALLASGKTSPDPLLPVRNIDGPGDPVVYSATQGLDL